VRKPPNDQRLTFPEAIQKVEDLGFTLVQTGGPGSIRRWVTANREATFTPDDAYTSEGVLSIRKRKRKAIAEDNDE
jgi:hypothetical protein